MLSRGHDGALVGILNWSRTLAGRACLVEGPKWQKHQPGVAVLFDDIGGLRMKAI